MAPIQNAILEALNGRELFMSDLVTEVSGKSAVSATDVKAEVLPLILVDRIEMTADRKLRLHTK